MGEPREVNLMPKWAYSAPVRMLLVVLAALVAASLVAGLPWE